MTDDRTNEEVQNEEVQNIKVTDRTSEEVQAILAERQRQKQYAARLVRQHKEIVQQAMSLGVRFVHVRNITSDGEDNLKGGCTVCYKPLNLDGDIKQTNLFEMSIALCHPNETYSPALGRYHSALNFLNNSVIIMRRPNKKIHYSEFIRQKFSEGEYF